MVEERIGAARFHEAPGVGDWRAPAWWTLASPDNHGVDIAGWADTDEPA